MNRINDKTIGDSLKAILSDFGPTVFYAPARSAGLIGDYIMDYLLYREKSLLIKLAASGALSFLSETASNDAYPREEIKRNLMKYSALSEDIAERVCVWSDIALGYNSSGNKIMTRDEIFFGGVKRFTTKVSVLLDYDNFDDVSVGTKSGRQIMFEQIAKIPIGDHLYVILCPTSDVIDMPDDEGVVFEVFENGDMILIEDDDTLDAVFEEYYELLEEEGICVD